MQTRTSKVVAKDGNVRIEISTRIIAPNGMLVRSEMDRLAQAAARIGADGVRTLPYTNFGPENTKVLV